jgi:hypothetical protein
LFFYSKPAAAESFKTKNLLERFLVPAGEANRAVQLFCCRRRCRRGTGAVKKPL